MKKLGSVGPLQSSCASSSRHPCFCCTSSRRLPPARRRAEHGLPPHAGGRSGHVGSAARQHSALPASYGDRLLRGLSRRGQELMPARCRELTHQRRLVTRRPRRGAHDRAPPPPTTRCPAHVTRRSCSRRGGRCRESEVAGSASGTNVAKQVRKSSTGCPSVSVRSSGAGLSGSIDTLLVCDYACARGARVVVVVANSMSKAA